MKKKGLLALLVFCAASLVAVVVGLQASPFKPKNPKGFKADSFVRDQESLLEQLALECRETTSASTEQCVDWSMVSWAWNSSAPAEFKRFLDQSCSLGSEFSCERLRRIEEAQQEQKWQKLQASEAKKPHSWPSIVQLAGAQPIDSWLDIGLQGAVAARGSEIDLVCGAVLELPETLLCVSQGNRQFNYALGRVVSYVEQGNKILTIEQHRTNPLLRFWQGSNLRREDFEIAVQLLLQAGEPLADEQRLWSWMSAQPWKYFLSFSAPSVFTGVPSHEFLHGLYFQSEDFRKVVGQTLGDSQNSLERLKFFVAKIFDTSDPYILTNEMQAYLLQHQSFLRDKKSETVREQIIRNFELKPSGFELERFMMGY